MRTSSRTVLLTILLAATTAVAQGDPPGTQVLDAGFHHLGDTVVDSWTRATAVPEGLSLRLKFQARRNKGEVLLLIDHRDVDNRWPIELNETLIDTLVRGKEFKTHVYLLPPGTLRDGANDFFLKCDKKSDDIEVGNIRTIPQTLRQYLKLRQVNVSVHDAGGRPIPARITVTDATGRDLVPIYYGEDDELAVRQGVVYTSVGKARFEVPEGEYLVHASRGMEWGVDTHKLQLGAEPAPTIELRIAREVDTTGYVASDTHVHTLQFSGHGDASALERIITLAGEGVELAIATDHNHHTDYQPFQRKLKLSEAFKSVTGSEVTTKNGHFNAFPMPVHGSKPNHKEQDWVKLVDDIRAKGAKVVILNHPRWPQVHTGPFGKQHFELNRLSGTRARGTGFTFDAMELVNATVKAPDPMYNFIDWFALLNHGEKIMAVGSSDSHTVGDPVGQGRTYLRSKTDVPSRIDVDEACRAFVQGRSSISQGLFTEVWVGDRRMGDTATLSDPKFEVRLRIACAGWCHPDRARLYLNGRKVADRKLDSVRGQATDIKVAFELDTPPNDAHLVCVATGPGIKERFWRAGRTNNYVLGATNPVYLDVDGDRKYQSPRHQAERLLRQNKTERALVEAVGKVDDAVAVQALGLLPAGRAKAIGSQLTGRKVLERFLAGLK